MASAKLGDRLREVIFEVRPDEAGRRLDAFLGARLRGLSRQRVKELIRSGLRPLGPGRLKPATLVRAGLRFALRYAPVEEEPLPDVPVVYEDDATLVVDKPAGLAVHPAGRHHRCTLTTALALRAGPKSDPAHRLDRETSGLLLCGRGAAATTVLKRGFAEGAIQKTYLAIVSGWPRARAFTIDLPMELGQGLVRVRMAVGRGKPAQTAVRLTARYADDSGTKFALSFGLLPPDRAPAPDPRALGGGGVTGGGGQDLWTGRGDLHSLCRAQAIGRGPGAAQNPAAGPPRGGAGLRAPHDRGTLPLRAAAGRRSDIVSFNPSTKGMTVRDNMVR